MVSCNDLLSLNIFKEIKLIGGRNGIYKNISWSYVCQTLDFSQWINGGELMFITGMGMDLNEEKIIDLIHQCIEKRISGLVILTNSEYISSISENIIDLANQVGLPLFDMPWNIKLIDVTKEIANYIMELNLNQNKDKEILNELLFSPNMDREVMTNLINQSKLKLDGNFFVSKFKLIKEPKNKRISYEYIENMIKSMLEEYNLKFILGSYENDIICIFELNKKEDFIQQKSTLISICNEVSKYIKISMSIGSLYDDIFMIRESYDEASKAYKLYESNDWDLSIIDYEKIGFYKILLEVSNYDKLRRYSHEVLGDIIIQDKNFDLLKTLRFYLKNNCNLINTSKEMFIHRNTLIYRLNKIKNILNDNLEDPILKNELMNAIMIYDYLKTLDYK
ncbi:MAG: PucR family transcriptional regulator ligand-binding domain-containing protein [Terrisporobacter sp.]|uniref:PucR family transcriptional regulator n=1 Tax=Terrisporobacter sp. TaxID=1965305 RepID=UPI002FCAE63C